MKKLYEESSVQDIADAIREKNGGTEKYKVAQMAAAVRGIASGGAEVFYIDLEGSYPNYTCPVAMADIKAAYEAGKVLKCRCNVGDLTETLPLVTVISNGYGWSFSTGGALSTLGQKPTLFSVAITADGVFAESTEVAKKADIPTVTSASVTDALGYTPRKAWYVNITGTLAEPIGDKTPAEIYQAYTEEYAVYAVVQMASLYSGMPFILPLVASVPVGDSYKVAFSTLAEAHLAGEGIVEITVTWNQRWYLFTSEIASTDDIPTTLKNPHALTITSGSTTVTYDGSKAKTIKIADAGELVTETTEILPAYTNQIPLSTDVSGAILNGVGYESGQLGMDGSVAAGTSFVSGFIPVKKGDVIRVKDPSSTNFSTGLVFALYNSSKATGSNIGRYINTMQGSASYGAISISGNVLTWDTSNIGYYFWNNFAYLRVTTNSAASIVTVNEEIVETTQKVMTLKPTVKVGKENLNFAVSEPPLAGRKIVVFGDSLIGMTRDQTSVPAYAAAYTGAEVYNVGFGGCRMAKHPSNGYAAFSMWALADAVAAGNYSTQDTQAPSGSDYFASQLDVLKSIDFTSVDAIVVHYGTNDFAANVPVDDPENLTSTDTVCGALRYSVQKILSAYPKIRIFLSLPIYRMWESVGAEAYKNGLGKTLPEYDSAMQTAAEAYNLPIIDGYKRLGINALNDSAFSTDGTHLNDWGRRQFGELIGGHLICGA